MSSGATTACPPDPGCRIRLRTMLKNSLLVRLLKKAQMQGAAPIVDGYPPRREASPARGEPVEPRSVAGVRGHPPWVGTHQNGYPADGPLSAACKTIHASVDRTDAISYSAAGFSRVVARHRAVQPLAKGGRHGEAGGGVFAARLRGLRPGERVSFSTRRSVRGQGYPGGSGGPPGAGETGIPGNAGDSHRRRGGGGV
jgi:hypothetical protein